MQPCSDEEAARLWEAYRQSGNPGDAAAFDRLYACFLPHVVRTCRALLRDAHLAEDAADAAFIRLMLKRPPVRSSFRGLLLATARNLCRSELARRDDPPAASPLDRSAPADPATEATRHEEFAALEDCLSQLSEQDRTLVILREAQGLTHQEIAEVLGSDLTPSTLSRRLKSSKDKLLRCLQEKSIFHANS